MRDVERRGTAALIVQNVDFQLKLYCGVFSRESLSFC